MRMVRMVLLAGIASAAIWGQTLVEYGLGAAAAGTAGASAGSKGISGVFSNLSKTLESTTGQAGKAASTGQAAKTAPTKPKAAAAQPAPATEAQAAAQPAEPPKPAVVYEDPIGIKVGMERAELLSRFGEPTMKITSGANAESMMYNTKESTVDVEVRAGKVHSVRARSKPKQAAAVTAQ